MSVTEQALAFDCDGDTLVGVLSVPARAGARGVLIVVGGPQYRAGSHRQFTLLARHLAEQGVPALRFDYRGMGDSSGARRAFEEVDADIRRAIDAFFENVVGLKDIVVWGLCDAASAALFYAHQDPRVSGVVLLNPWVRTEEGIARAQLKHYYAGRLADPELWRKLARGEFDFRGAAAGFLASVRKVLRGGLGGPKSGERAGETSAAPRTLPERMAEGFARFRGRALFILSGNDLTAQEFKDTVRRSPRWRELLDSPRVAWRELAPADHTFSTREWRDQVAAWTAEWVRSY